MPVSEVLLLRFIHLGHISRIMFRSDPEFIFGR